MLPGITTATSTLSHLQRSIVYPLILLTHLLVPALAIQRRTRVEDIRQATDTPIQGAANAPKKWSVNDVTEAMLNASLFPGGPSLEPVIAIVEGIGHVIDPSADKREDEPTWCYYARHRGWCEGDFLFAKHSIATDWCPVTCGRYDDVATENRNEMEAVLKRHNTYRKTHGVSDLAWEDAWASQAQNWADNCKLNHSDLGNGENLWAGPRSFNGNTAIDACYNEIDAYNFSKPGDSGSTVHFTQIGWSGTSKIGCAVKKCTTLPPTSFENGTILVCEYSPHGNIIGQFEPNASGLESDVAGNQDRNFDIVSFAAVLATQSRTRVKGIRQAKDAAIQGAADAPKKRSVNDVTAAMLIASLFPGGPSLESVIASAEGIRHVIEPSVDKCEDKAKWCYYARNRGWCEGNYLFAHHSIGTYWCPVTCGRCDDVATENRSEMEAILKRHNTYRKAHGVRDLAWDDALASQAQNLADRILATERIFGLGLDRSMAMRR